MLLDKRKFFIYCAVMSLWNALVRDAGVMTVLAYDQASINVIYGYTYLDCTLQKILLSMKIKGKFKAKLEPP